MNKAEGYNSENYAYITDNILTVMSNYEKRKKNIRSAY